MDWVRVVSAIASLVSVSVAVGTWLTSARKSQVESLCAIVEAQAEYIQRLEVQLREARAVADAQDTRIEALEDELERAQARLAVLSRENCHYRRILERENIDPADYEECDDN